MTRITVEFDWSKNIHPTNIETFLIRYGKFPRGFLEERWEDFSLQQQRWILYYQNITKGWVEENWDRISGVAYGGATAKYYAIQYDTVSLNFILAHWEDLGENGKEACFKFRELSIRFILDNWKEFTRQERNLCWQHQKLHTRLEIDQLPLFMVDADEDVRTKAVKRLQKGKKK